MNRLALAVALALAFPLGSLACAGGRKQSGPPSKLNRWGKPWKEAIAVPAWVERGPERGEERAILARSPAGVEESHLRDGVFRTDLSRRRRETVRGRGCDRQSRCLAEGARAGVHAAGRERVGADGRSVRPDGRRSGYGVQGPGAQEREAGSDVGRSGRLAAG